jgi:amidase
MSTPPEYLFWSACRLASAIRKRQLGSLEIVNACLDRLEQIDPIINAAVQVVHEKARARAIEMDHLTSAGDFCGPLHGVPISIKDSLDTAGIVSTGGTLGRKEFIPEKNAPVVERLLSAGAVLLAKTNTPELTFGGETDNLLFGRTCNPYDPALSPGGSSGGSVAITAAGASALDLGSDTGGSIREPAHFCGVAGIKPTSGTTPRTGHIVPWGTGVLDSLTQIGPIARYVEDIELGLSVIRGPDGIDPYIMPVPWRAPAAIDPVKLRIAFYTDNGVVPVCADIERVVKQTALMLEQQGTLVDQKVLPDIPLLSELLVTLRQSAMGPLVRRLIKEYGTTRVSAELESYMDTPDLMDDKGIDIALLERIDAVRSSALRFMGKYDAIVCPASRHLPRPHGASLADTYEQWSHVTVHNLLGWPGVVVRAGTSLKGNMPVGVQIITAPWREDIALALAKNIESLMGGYQPPEF